MGLTLTSTIIRPTTTTTGGGGDGGSGSGSGDVTATTNANENENVPSPAALFLRPFTLPLDIMKASFELQSLDDIDEKRLENVRILTKLIRPTTSTTSSTSTKGGEEGAEEGEGKTTTTTTNDASSNKNNNTGAFSGGPSTTTIDTIGKFAREASKRRFALARIGVRFTGTLASVQAERLRDRALFMKSVISSSSSSTNTSTNTNTNKDHRGDRNVAELAEL